MFNYFRFHSIKSISFQAPAPYTPLDVSTRPHRQSITLSSLFQPGGHQDQDSSDHLNSLLVKSSLDSQMFDYLPFTKLPDMSAIYSTADSQNVRFGLMLEDFDILAGRTAYSHSDGFNPARPLSIVTACVDRIHLLQPLRLNRDYIIESRITNVGRSSMEVGVSLYGNTGESKLTFDHFSSNQPPDREAHNSLIREEINSSIWEQIIYSQFVMVARDKHNKPALVNQLSQSSSDSNQVRVRKRREVLKQNSLSTKPPTSEESKILHSLFINHRDTDINGYCNGKNGKTISIEMGTTRKSNYFVTHHTDRNIHQRVFGGIIMRNAFELAYTTVFSLLQKLGMTQMPSIISMDDVLFMSPVSIGDILHYESIITGSDIKHKTFQVSVKATVEGKDIPSGSFYFTFGLEPKKTSDTRETSPLSDKKHEPTAEEVFPQIMPKTYEEAMEYLEGRRRRLDYQ